MGEPGTHVEKAEPAGNLPRTCTPADLATLSAAHRKFAEEWLKIAGEKGAQTRAYMLAYPNCKKARTATVEGGRLLRDPRIAAYLDVLREKVAEKSASCVAEMKALLLTIARADVRRLYAAGELLSPEMIPDDLAPALAAIAEDVIPRGKGDDIILKRKVKLWDKLGTIRTLLEMEGALNPPVDPRALAPRATFIFNLGAPPAAGIESGKGAAIADRRTIIDGATGLPVQHERHAVKTT